MGSIRIQTSFFILIFIISLSGCTTAQKNKTNILNNEITLKKGESNYNARSMESNLDSGLSILTNQIIESLSETKKSKIAIVEFSNIDGEITTLGKYIAEELTTRLFRTNKFLVVERNLLNKVIDEYKLSVSGFIDENTAKEIGMILGVDAIATGTITDLGNAVKINARLISTEKGSLFSVASAKINKDLTIKKLMVRTGPSLQTTRVQTGENGVKKASSPQTTKTQIKTNGVKKVFSSESVCN